MLPEARRRRGRCRVRSKNEPRRHQGTKHSTKTRMIPKSGEIDRHQAPPLREAAKQSPDARRPRVGMSCLFSSSQRRLPVPSWVKFRSFGRASGKLSPPGRVAAGCARRPAGTHYPTLPARACGPLWKRRSWAATNRDIFLMSASFNWNTASVQQSTMSHNSSRVIGFTRRRV